MSSNISVIPVPKPAPFEYGGNPNQNAFLRQTASINNQLARNNAFMGGKIKNKVFTLSQMWYNATVYFSKR